MGTIVSSGPRFAGVATAAAVTGVLGLAAVASVFAGLRSQECMDPASAEPTSTAASRIPANYLDLYRSVGAAYDVPWAVLAAIGAIETDHGRSRLPGVQSGVNSFGCCAGPMQFNITNGPPSTWQSYRVDGDGDDDTDPYDPADAIASAGRYLRALVTQSHGDIRRAVYGYNHSSAYVADVLARARAFSAQPEAALAAPTSQDCATLPPGAGPANLRRAERLQAPREYAMLPAWAMAGGRPAEPIDAASHSVWPVIPSAAAGRADRTVPLLSYG
jgi:hypothetical protein